MSVLLAQITYPLMSACAAFWMSVSFTQWWRSGSLDRFTNGLFLLTVLIQFNWLAVLAGAPWWIEDMTPYRLYIRVGWSIVAVSWVVHSVVMVRTNGGRGGTRVLHLTGIGAGLGDRSGED